MEVSPAMLDPHPAIALIHVKAPSTIAAAFRVGFAMLSPPHAREIAMRPAISALHSAVRRCVTAVTLLTATHAGAQNASSWNALELYANLETGGVTASVNGDANRNATVNLQWRRVGEPAFHPAQPLVRVDASHLVGSLFHLLPATAYEISATLSDPDGVSGAATRTTSASTRADTLPEPSLRTLYVATTGSDDHDGLSPAHALRSLQRAADLAQPGDLVRVAPGRYHESVDIAHSGSAAQPIVFRGDGSGVVLDGSTTLAAGTPWVALGGGVFRTPLGFDTAHVVSEQGRLFRYASASALQTLAAGAPGGFWFDAGTRQLSIKFADGSSPATHTLAVADLDTAFTVDGLAHVRIENFDIRHYGSDEYGKGVYLRRSSDCIVRNNRFLDLGSAGIWVKGGSRHRIEDNDFRDTSITQWPWPVTKGSTAENNAILFTDDIGRGNVIRRNQTDGSFNGIAPCGSQPPAGGFSNETDVYRNVLRHHNDDALEPDGYCANLRIFDNRISDSHMGISVAPTSPGPVWIVRNIGWNIGNTRSHVLDGYLSSFLKINSGYAEQVGPLLMYHNTIATTVASTEALYLLNPGNASTLRSRNNLYAATRDVWVKVNPIAVDADYDLLHSSDDGSFVRWMGTHYANLAALRSGLGLELNGLSAPPRLSAAENGNFLPLPDSPVIDRGVVLPGINDGFSGAAPDIGAIEYADDLFADGFDS